MPEEAYIDGLGQRYATLGYLNLAGLGVQGFKVEGSGLYIYMYIHIYIHNLGFQDLW